ncbi:hypothetical protein QJQ45_016231 [Haematococcus lacustris]|nr:hypothetical protein QJQ45_016231 [Haematococcus lacustris]
MARTDDNVKEFPEKLFNERVAYGETGALYATGLLDPQYHGRHTELTHSQVMMADMCIAELASAGGQGTDRVAGDARFNLHQRWLMPNALQLFGLTYSVLDTVLTANPCMWWQTYGHGFGVLRDVAMRLLSIPATSAYTERVFSTFKHFQALSSTPPINVNGQNVDELLHLLQPEGTQGHKGTDKVE